MKNKIGQYACYDKMIGCHTGRLTISSRNDIRKSNKDSKLYFWDLITEDERYFGKIPIPQNSPNWNSNTLLDCDTLTITCQICYDNFTPENMHHIANSEDDVLYLSTCNTCNG